MSCDTLNDSSNIDCFIFLVDIRLLLSGQECGSGQAGCGRYYCGVNGTHSGEAGWQSQQGDLFRDRPQYPKHYCGVNGTHSGEAGWQSQQGDLFRDRPRTPNIIAG